MPKAFRRAIAVFLYFFTHRPLRGCLMLASMVVAGLLEGIGIAALLPVLNSITGGAGGGSSAIARWVTEALTWVGLPETLGVLLLLVFLLISAKALVLIYAARQIGYTAASVTMNLRLELLRNLMRARWSFFVRQRMGSISASMTSEPTRAAATYVQVSRALTGVLQIGVYLLLSLAISVEVSLAALVVGVASSIMLHRFVITTGKAGRRQTLLTKSLLSRLSDSLLAMKSIKVMAREPQFSEILMRDIKAMRKAQYLQLVARESLIQYREPITTAALALGLYAILTYSSLDLESLLIMAFLFLRIVARVGTLQNNFQSIAGTLPAYWFLRSVMSTAKNAEEPLFGSETPEFRESIKLDRVTFGFDKNNPVLSEATINIPKGTFVAIIGPSGSGKTTAADLVTGLLRPGGGQVLLDGKPLQEHDLHAWRRMVGYVPQDTLLLHDSILTNVTLQDGEISRDMAQRALEDAGAWPFVSALPQGIDTTVGERGSRLSGGQRQRIAIARALVRNPKLLILDEATTALDPDTEAQICRALARLRGQITILAISHQPAIQQAADIVYLLENGKINAESDRRSSVPATPLQIGGSEG